MCQKERLFFNIFTRELAHSWEEMKIQKQEVEKLKDTERDFVSYCIAAEQSDMGQIKI